MEPMTGIGLFAAAAGVGVSILRGRRKIRESETHGRARWAYERELRDEGMIVPVDAPLRPGRWIIGPSPFNPRERIELTERQLLTGLLIIGPTGAGKTSGNIAINAARWNTGSMIATDPKSELHRETSGYFDQAIRYAPHDPERSACFNMIPLCGQSPHASRLFARAIVESDGGARQEKVWRDTSTTLLSGVFAHAATLPEPTLATAYDFLTSPAHRGDKIIDALGASSSPVAKRCAVKLSHADARLRGSIIVPTAEMMAWLEDPEIRRFTSASTEAPDFGQLRKASTAVYLCIEEADLDELKAFTTLFWTVALYQLKRTPATVPVCLVLDELANVGKIPNFEREVTLNRGRGISIVGCIQAKSQMDDLYGRDKASTIFGNMRSKIVMSGLDFETGDLVSRMIGQKTEVTPKESTTKRGGFFGGETSKTESDAEHAKRLLFYDDINALDWKHQICFFPYKRPLITERFTFTEGCPAKAQTPLGKERTHYPMTDAPIKPLSSTTGGKVTLPPVPTATPKDDAE